MHVQCYIYIIAGISVTWIQAPPDDVRVGEEFTVTYELLIEDDEFWDWAVTGADYNVFSDVSSASIT